MMENQTRDTRVYSPYTLPQPSGLLAVKEYLLTDMEEGRFLLLRWVRELEFPVDTLTYEIVMLDSVGAELGRKTVTHVASDIPAAEVGEAFALKRGIPVEMNCMSVRIRVTEVKSGAYVYRVVGEAVHVDYIPQEPWKLDPKAGKKEKLTDRNPLRVRSKRTEKVSFLWPAALLAVLILVGSLVLPPLVKQIAQQIREKAPQSTPTVSAIVQIL
ncbi:MAG: hypothetical protein IKU90_07300 [Clostridia bacterium]|nr:hypothetical protein [Clostridia bacterium]